MYDENYIIYKLGHETILTLRNNLVFLTQSTSCLLLPHVKKTAIEPIQITLIYHTLNHRYITFTVILLRDLDQSHFFFKKKISIWIQFN